MMPIGMLLKTTRRALSDNGKRASILGLFTEPFHTVAFYMSVVRTFAFSVPVSFTVMHAIFPVIRVILVMVGR